MTTTPRPQTAEQFIAEADAAAELAKKTIREKAQLYGAVYLFAFVACVVLFFYAGWFRWVAGLFVAACLLTAWSMRGALAELRRAHLTLGCGDSVLHNHRVLNLVALALLCYALAAVWVPLPVPSLAVFVAAIINFTHYAGYRGRPGHG